MLDAEGFSVAPGLISDALTNVFAQIARSTSAKLARLIPAGLLGRAGALWASLTTTSAAGAATAAATQTATGDALAGVARVDALRAVDLRGLRATRLRGSLATAAQKALLTRPMSASVRPFVASAHLTRRLVVLGGNLAGDRAQIVVYGPHYAAVRDVRVIHRLAGGVIILPRKRAAGRWYAGIVDYNALRDVHGRVTGRTILEAATWVAR